MQFLGDEAAMEWMAAECTCLFNDIYIYIYVSLSLSYIIYIYIYTIYTHIYVYYIFIYIYIIIMHPLIQLVAPGWLDYLNQQQ